MARGGTRFRRRAGRSRARLRGRRAVVSVVGTLLALLVFFALFGIFLTQYVPLWMTDDESQFTAQTQSSFADLKADMDLQATLGTAPVFSTPFVMASQNIPLFTQPTSGVMNFVPQTAGVFANVSTTVGPGDSGPFYQNYSLGSFSMTLPNRYFAPQTFELEDDGVIQSQSDLHQIVAYPPELSFNVSGTTAGVTLEIFQLVGNATQAVSSGTEQVYTHYRSTQVFYASGPTGTTFNGKMVLGTHYACAWQSFLNTTIRTAGLPPGLAALTPTGCVSSQLVTHNLVMTLTGISSLTLIVASFQLIIGVGVE